MSGSHSQEQIYQAYRAYVESNQNIFNPVPPQVRDFITTNLAWMQTMIRKNFEHVQGGISADVPESVYWRQVDLVLKQINGTLAAYDTISLSYSPYFV